MRRWVSASLVLVSAVFARAADAPTAAPPELGPRFSGPYDVSFKPFIDAKKAEERQSSGELARFARDDKHWNLVFDRAELPDPLPLKDFRGDRNELQAGYLSVVVNKLRAVDPSADVLRQEPIDLGDLQIGVVAAVTHDKANRPVLLQETLMQSSDKIYYGLTMTCPMEVADPQKSLAAREAAAVFKAIIDSIERVDLTALRLDQEDRLFATRQLFTQWTKAKILAALVPERYLRFRRDGKDIGYAYAVEQPADALPKSGGPSANPPTDPATATGFRVGLRSHMAGEAGRSVDLESFMFVTFDRKHEVWSNLSIVADPAARTNKDKRQWFSEVGATDQEDVTEFEHGLNHDDFKDYDARSRKDPSAKPYKMVTKYRLTVRSEGVSAVQEPTQRMLPPFYLPEALLSLLPRIVALDDPKGYLFATYDSGSRQIMMHYLDVKTEREVKLDGQLIRAIPVTEKVGFSGSLTTHYLSRKGQYLGSVNEDAKVEVTPTDRATLERIWVGANLTVPSPTTAPTQ